MTVSSFDYGTALTRNLGWVTEEEQAMLRAARVGIAGMGGVGGSHLLTLSRLGIGNFHLADFDHFELHNMNRQAGATVSKLGRAKIDVMVEMAHDINPELSITPFENGVTDDNVDAFLDGVDIYVDGLDFFALDIRQTVFAECRARGIPAVTAAPLGMGTALLVFTGDSPSFEDYFQLDGHPPGEQALRFAMGLAPTSQQFSYLAEAGHVDLPNQRGPSTAMACELCAGVVGTEVLKLVLNRGRIRAVPWVTHFDAYLGRLRKTWRPGGNRNPLQRLLLALARRRFG